VDFVKLIFILFLKHQSLKEHLKRNQISTTIETLEDKNPDKISSLGKNKELFCSVF
jgi:hypothetical protein